LGFWIINRKENKYRIKKKFYLGKSAIIFSVICITLFGFGLSVSMHSSQNGNEQENQLLFPQWQQQINLIENIYLEKNGKKLHFYKKDGLWYIKGYENYPMFQRRIINLIASIANARYLEKKSARAEYLPKFGLDAENVTTMTFSDAKNKNIIQFDIGKYDEEVGRGGRGAFLKFKNRFQVWLVEVDIISLDTNWRQWTMNNALDLRFGRILESDVIDNSDVLVILSKELLNTPLTLIENKPNNLQLLNTIKLTFENGDIITIYFEKNEEAYYVRYQFNQPISGDYLKLFAKYADNKYYMIPQNNMEKITDVFSSIEP